MRDIGLQKIIMYSVILQRWVISFRSGVPTIVKWELMNAEDFSVELRPQTAMG